jgi:hypothetical protein
VNDIRARAAELKNSSRQSDRLLGQLLLLALEVPGEDCIYALGDQPVLIFWGHLADVPTPQAGVIDRMIAASRKVKTTTVANDVVRPQETIATVAAGPAAVAAAKPRYRWLPPVLWGVFVVLCVVIGLDLLAACGLGLPWRGDLGDLLVNYCPVPADDAAARQLQELESQNAALLGQLERLLGQTAGRQQQCALQPTPVVVPPVVDPTHKSNPPPVPPIPCGPNQQGPGCTTLQIPKKPSSNSFLAGCWGGPSQVGGTPVMERYCFKENGEGTVTFSGQNGLECHGAVHASLVPPGPHLVINRDASPCNQQGFGSIISRVINCAQDAEGQTACSENRNGQNFGITLQRLPEPAAAQ